MERGHAPLVANMGNTGEIRIDIALWGQLYTIVF